MHFDETVWQWYNAKLRWGEGKGGNSDRGERGEGEFNSNFRQRAPSDDGL